MANPDDFGRVAGVFDSIADEIGNVTDAELAEVAHLAVNIITLRTKAGVDVDGRPFERYTDDYAKERERAGYGTKPDLARSGHMLGAMMPTIESGDAVVRFANPLEAVKASAHDSGVDKDVYVRSHSRGTHVDSKGRRVSRKEVALDKKRKNKRVFQRMEQVDKHPRHMNIKRRHFFDITQPREVELLYEPLGNGMIGRITKSVK